MKYLKYTLKYTIIIFFFNFTLLAWDNYQDEALITKAQARKVKTDKLNHIKSENFCASKGTINRVKKQPTEQEKICVKFVSNKRSTSRTYKELLQFNNNKITQLKDGQMRE